MIQNHSFSKENIPLQTIFNNLDEILFFHTPLTHHKIHKHYTILVWILGNIRPTKIAILDNDFHQITQKTLYEIIHSFELNCQCYCNYITKKYNDDIETTSFLPIEAATSPFNLMYVNNINQSFKNTSLLNQDLPDNTTIIVDNVYAAHPISKENIPYIEIWKNKYDYFEFLYHNGLIIFHTGKIFPSKLKELFDLNHTPLLAQRFKKRCAFIDQHWTMLTYIHNHQKKFEQNNFLEEKIQKNLLERQVNSLNSQIKSFGQIESKQQQNQPEQKLHYNSKELCHIIDQLYQNYQQLTQWKENFTNKINQLTKIFHNQQNESNYINIIKEILSKNEKIENKIHHIRNFIYNYEQDSSFSSNILKEINTLLESIASISSLSNSENIIKLKEVFSFLNTITTSRQRHILFIAGEPHTPGVIYRCYRNANACIMAGHQARVIEASKVNPDIIKWADVILLWRVEFSGHINGILELSKEWQIPTAFDADDIVFKPHFAHIEIIDGIRTIGTTESKTEHTFSNMRQTLMRTDFAIATTKEMREHMAQELIPKHAGPLIFTLPNVFDDDCVKLSRFAARIQHYTKNDDIIRIGYASGTRTHQRDFAIVLPTLISIFQKRPNVRLVLFREAENHRPILHMNEFPELSDYTDYIEWRDTVPLERLPQELARFDISIAPLEAHNVFCNAKSELKYFEAALANVCSVVSPTGPLKRCITHEVTGFLASTNEEWENYLLKLIDDKLLRQQIAQNAYHSVLWNFSLQRQSKLCGTMLQSLTNEVGATRATETIIARGEYKSRHLPVIPPSNLLFDYDNLQESEVTVVITSYNYSQYLLEALESVRAQTLSNIDLIIVDDGSSDDSIDLLMQWAERHKNRFNRFQIHQSIKNVGLGGARNIGIAASETLYSMQLDADNRLMPDTCEKLLNALRNTNIGYAYPLIQHFGAEEAIGGHIPFHPLRLTVGNYIDAMAMIAKWAWAAVGGFYVQRDAMGWEDYDLWCCLAEMGIGGTQVSEAIAEYRAHFTSMTNLVTEQNNHKPKVVSYLETKHPWLDIVYPEDSPWMNK